MGNSVKTHYKDGIRYDICERGREGKWKKTFWDAEFINGRFTVEFGGSPATCAVLASRGGKILGILKVLGYKGRSVSSQGTWVHEEVRQKGVAKALWTKLLNHMRPKKVWVSTLSDRGHTLVSSLRERHKQISFTEQEWGDRKLRDMRQRKKRRRRNAK